MKIVKIATVLAIALFSVAGYAQHKVICDPVGIDRGNGIVPFSAKKIIVNTGAFTIKTDTEVFTGSGRENVNDRGEKWYGYTNNRNGDNAVVVFRKDGGMSLIVAVESIILFTECSKI